MKDPHFLYIHLSVLRTMMWLVFKTMQDRQFLRVRMQVWIERIYIDIQ